MVLTKTTIYSASWTAIKDFLNDNLTDPVTNSKSSTRKWVYNRIPEIKGRGFRGFPFVTVSDSSINQQGQSFGIGKKDRLFKFAIIIYSKKKDNTGTSPQLDSLSNELLRALDTETSLKTAGLHTPIIEDSPVDEIDLEGIPVLTRAFGLTCQNVMDVG